jgi:uncharacterized membrane protein YphA (DoxX/SURF4 family)
VKGEKIGYWIATALVVVAFAGSGVGNLIRAPHIAHDMEHLGYPTYFMTVLGTWKVLGAIAVLVPRFPRLKEWAYAGMMFDLTGAMVSRAVSGDGTGGVLPPLVVAGMVIASWLLRPQSRTLRPSVVQFRREGDPA